MRKRKSANFKKIIDKNVKNINRGKSISENSNVDKKVKNGGVIIVSLFYTYAISVTAICWGLQILFGRIPRIDGFFGVISICFKLLLVSVFVSYGRCILHFYFSKKYSTNLRTIVRIGVDIIALVISVLITRYRFDMFIFGFMVTVLYILVYFVDWIYEKCSCI